MPQPLPAALVAPTVQAILPVDLTELLAIFMGVSIVLIPVIGITARFALKPTVEALARLFEHRGMEETVGILERRVRLLESQLENVESTVERLTDVSEFNRDLAAPTDTALPASRRPPPESQAPPAAP